ncbi:MAG: pyridoxamine 5'-phosphate oxidase [Gemmatimonadales bacterium]|nr:pyridoxamine 5'-phosphate oxidase [Gemmatimonadales bacterium]NIN12156.1 pyridoxamine 5'-phosphate oxidase [Gemmatimonadales bacterium]NIN50577.1 pyridoxamine 5'-phosphate oxidase [Gemmatimonadales bacterium]NIP08041.1 pyridoxamine 5'-phosphate oxidase [Gemmatimonadales bacterium]NIR00623.1 pyridoxamine 5'-phosphate oxidase [Gemmatimonadales bacterium]
MSLRSKIRTLYTLGKGLVRGLSEQTAGDDPIALFAEWFEDVRRSGVLLPDSMTLATCTKDGLPSARMMLLKAFDERGFVFYTNYDSRKCEELLENPVAALVFHWPFLQRQVRVEGSVERISTEESSAYFQTRPRGSQLGAWASKQSAVLGSRRELERRFKQHDRQFRGSDVPLPPFWGGFRVAPHLIEFWQGRLNRLHDRLCYTLQEGEWTRTRLYP